MTEDVAKRTCPKCGHENEPEALVCARCGTPLKPTTYPVSDVKPPRAEPQPAEPKPTTTPSPAKTGIALWMRNDPLPVLIEPGTSVVLGRQTDPQKDPAFLVDLTPYGAYRLGVSRRHVQIDCKGEECLLLDLGSSNGTWVNGLKLRPYQPVALKLGNRINLAQLEIIVGPLSDEARARVAQARSTSSETAPPTDKAKPPQAAKPDAKPPAPTTGKAPQSAEPGAKPPAPTTDKPPQAAEPNAKPPKPTDSLPAASPTGADAPGKPAGDAAPSAPESTANDDKKSGSAGNPATDKNADESPTKDSDKPDA